MPELQLTDVSEETLVRLRELARHHGGDVQAEAAACLQRGLSEREYVEAELKDLSDLRGEMKGVWLTDAMIERATREGRA